MAAKKSKSDTKTVTRYTTKGTKVTVSEDTAKKLGGGYSSSKPSKSSS